MIPVVALVLYAAATEISLGLENQRVCLLQLRRMKGVTASKIPIHQYYPYEKKQNVLCGMGPECKMTGLNVEDSDGIYRSIRFPRVAATQSPTIESFDNSVCEEACNAKTDCAGFLLSADHGHYSCDFLDQESIKCVGTASHDLTSEYTCFKKTMETRKTDKHRAHHNRQYDRYDMASLFYYAYKSSSCEVDPSTSAKELVDQINTVRHVLDYRVGDVIRKAGNYWLPSRENLMDERYNGTALQTILKRCSDLESCSLSLDDFAQELASIGEASGFSKPGNGTIVAYIRAGDIIDYQNYTVGEKLRDSMVMQGIRSALAAGYERLEFVVVEAYADRDEYGDQGAWMYSESKHEANRKDLLAAVRGLHEFVCSGTPGISFGVVSPVSADETLFYLMHASMLVADAAKAGGFNAIGKRLAQIQSSEAVII
jgi:hypothetical protein